MTSRKGPAWLQREDETDAAYARFKAFLYAPPKTSLKTIAAELGVSYDSIQNQSAQYNWRARKKAFMAEGGVVVRRELAVAAREFAGGVVNSASELVSWSLESLLAKRARGEELEVKEAIQALKVASDLLSAFKPEGQTTVINVDMENVEDDKLEELDDLLKKIGI